MVFMPLKEKMELNPYFATWANYLETKVRNQMMLDIWDFLMLLIMLTLILFRLTDFDRCFWIENLFFG